MRQNGQPRAPADTAPTTLLVMTSLGAVDGTIMLLAASGGLSSMLQAILVGLTVISGAGAWIAAREAFGGMKRRRDYAMLACIATISIAATVGAAWLGATVGAAVSLHVLPKVIGVVLFLVAAEVGGLRLPKVQHVPLPVVAVLGGLVLEGVLQWIP